VLFLIWNVILFHLVVVLFLIWLWFFFLFSLF